MWYERPTGELVVHHLNNVVNAFDLIVICGAVPIIKVDLPKPKRIQENLNVTFHVVQGIVYHCHHIKNLSN